MITNNDPIFDTSITIDVADEIEKAFVYEQSLINKQLLSIQKQVNSNEESLSECSMCGSDIPIERQKAIKGCKLCIDCQTEIEKKNSRGVR